jgi:hypothetical protein
MKLVKLIHWNAEEAAERAQLLRAAGYTADHKLAGGSSLVRDLAADPPVAIVVDLSRLPAQGRDLAILLRMRKGTRQVPLVFVGGDPAKVARIQALLPDGVYTQWDEIGETLPGAIENPPKDPVVPESQFQAYAGVPLHEKLGIKPGAKVALIDAPEGFDAILGNLPQGVELGPDLEGDVDLAIWFTRSLQDLQQGISKMAALVEQAPLWIAWPKVASGVETDLTQGAVRETGMGAGLVDYKICSIDKVWSGLLFTQKRKSG